MTNGLPSPDELVAALETAGFVQTERSDTRHRRFAWPSGNRSPTVTVALDGGQDGSPLLVAALMRILEDADCDGQAARAVLDLITPRPDVPPGQAAPR